MESLGRKLREAREKHNYNLEQVARDTHISKQYIEALEEESFGVIPGDTYVVGFLRNYAEYLGLNPDELVGLYRNLRIQEQPMPMSELLQGAGPRPRSRALLFILVGVVVIAVGVFLLVRFGLPRGERLAAPAATVKPAAGGHEYVLSEDAITRWYSQEEGVSVPLDGEQYQVKLAEVADTLTLKVPGGTLNLAVGQVRQLDLDGDAVVDIRLQLNDLDVTGGNRRANLSIFRLPRGALASGQPETPGAAGVATPAGGTGGAVAAGTAVTAAAPTAAASASAAAASSSAAAPTTSAAAPTTPVSFAQPLDIQAAAAPAPFRLSISFRGYVLLRYLADGDTRDERFFHKGETFSLDVKREARLWISNAGALRLSVGGKDVELGRQGEVVTRTVRWTDASDAGGYRLQVLAAD